MPDPSHLPHEVVDLLGNPAGLGRHANKFHAAGFGKQTGPVQVVFAGKHTNFLRALSCSLFDQIQGKMEVFPSGGGLILDPDPIRINTELRQFLIHGSRLRNRFVLPLSAGDDGDHLRIGFQIVISPVDPVPQGGRRAGDPDLGPQHHHIIHRLGGTAEAGLDDDTLGNRDHRDADSKADGKYPADHGNRRRKLGQQDARHLIKRDDPRQAHADQRGKAVAPQDEAQKKSRRAQRTDDQPRQQMNVFHRFSPNCSVM